MTDLPYKAFTSDDIVETRAARDDVGDPDEPKFEDRRGPEWYEIKETHTSYDAREAYDASDPKHPDYYDTMSGWADA